MKGTLLDQYPNQEDPIREMINFCKGVRPCTSYWLIVQLLVLRSNLYLQMNMNPAKEKVLKRLFLACFFYIFAVFVFTSLIEYPIT